MSKSFLRAAAGLVLALAVAAVTTPALGDDAGEGGDVVRAAGAGTPKVVGGVEAAAAPTVLQELADRVAADVVAAQQAAALERLAAAQDAAELERLAAAVEAEKLQRLAAAIEAQQAAEAEAARRAEAERAAATTRAPAGSIDAIIQRYFGAEAPTARRVAQCESGLNPRAVSPGGGNHGLFQINNVHQGRFEAVTGAPWSAIYDAELNTMFAHHLWSEQGWGPWACA